jgi:hypothetical protein
MLRVGDPTRNGRAPVTARNKELPDLQISGRSLATSSADNFVSLWA